MVLLQPEMLAVVAEVVAVAEVMETFKRLLLNPLIQPVVHPMVLMLVQ